MHRRVRRVRNAPGLGRFPTPPRHRREIPGSGCGSSSLLKQVIVQHLPHPFGGVVHQYINDRQPWHEPPSAHLSIRLKTTLDETEPHTFGLEGRGIVERPAARGIVVAIRLETGAEI